MIKSFEPTTKCLMKNFISKMIMLSNNVMLHSSNYALMWYCSIIFTDRNNFHFAKACWVSCKHHSLPKITNNNIRMLNTKYVYVFWWLISWFCQLAIQASTTSKQCILKYIGHNNNTKKGRQHQILYILSKSIENIKIQLWLEVKYLRSLIGLSLLIFADRPYPFSKDTIHSF